MFNPKNRILITNTCFAGDGVICLGGQLITIINSIKNLLPKHAWYGGDVQAVGKNARKYNLNGFNLNIIGSDLKFIEYCSGIVQFIWGVFLCIDEHFLSQNIRSVEVGTEDEPFRPLTLEGVLIEIRAFDTSFFELYSEDTILMKEISKMYSAEIIHAKS